MRKALQLSNSPQVEIDATINAMRRDERLAVACPVGLDADFDTDGRITKQMVTATWEFCKMTNLRIVQGN